MRQHIRDIGTLACVAGDRCNRIPSKLFVAGCVSILLLVASSASAIGDKKFVRFQKGSGEFLLSSSGRSAPLCVSSSDYPGVLLIAKDFQNDIARVTGSFPALSVDSVPRSKEIVLIGTIGKSALIQKLVEEKQIDVGSIAGKWESFIIESVHSPFPGVDRALVIAGSDKRGTIYGMFEISEQIGVSPWYWWADVPIKHHDDIYIDPGLHSDGPPSVKYRGIFLNDEWPDLTNWVAAKFGSIPVSDNPPIPPFVANYGHQFYEKVFELLLRLKANYLWPAMWNNAFNEDDPENAKLADEYGIVMGTSHQEPMLRAQKEWDRRYEKTLGSWNYVKYPDTLENFWRAGIRRNKNYESIITIGLRGANDTPMAPGGPDANMSLLEKIVGVQRKILAEEMNSDVTKIPQLWCLYKEVLDFYNAGMRAPDDVTLLWPDDNWGNLRRLPTASERKRPGGAGIYYHFDYHGAPRNYQWINTDPIPKIWDQMSLAKQYGADRIWIVNVGHLKGYELPIQFFMDLAWNSSRWTSTSINDYARQWAAEQFDENSSREIADILSACSKYNGRIKPELLQPETYSIVNYNEAENEVSEFDAIAEKAAKLNDALPESERDAFYELVLFPSKVSSILNEMYYAAGLNQLYAKQERILTDSVAARTRALFAEDTSLFGYFNRTFAGGKWDHFMDQPVIGYTGWNQPPENTLAAIDLKRYDPPAAASMGIQVEGSEDAWPSADAATVLPGFDAFSQQKHFLEIFNKGTTPFHFAATPHEDWIIVKPSSGNLTYQTRVWVSIDWKKIPPGTTRGTLDIAGAGSNATLKVNVSRIGGVTPKNLDGFVEEDGCVSIEAAHYSAKSDYGSSRWVEIKQYGNTLSGMRAEARIDSPVAVPGEDSPSLEYKIFLVDTGKAEIESVFGPSLNFVPGRAVRYGVSIDGGKPDVVTLVPADYNVQNSNSDWGRAVILNARRGSSSFMINKSGYHKLKIWMVDPGIVLEKIIVNLGGVKSSFLGPPESFCRNVKNIE